MRDNYCGVSDENLSQTGPKAAEEKLGDNFGSKI